MPTYLNKENRNKYSKSDVKEYPLPYDEETIVRVKQQSIGRMNRYSEAVKGGGSKAKKATYSLIADSIVDEEDEPIWTREEVADLENAKCELVNALIKMIGECNGADDKEVEEMVGEFEQAK